MWKAYLIEVKTGLVGPEVEMSTNGRYDIMLNGIEAATVTVQKSSLRGIERKWMMPWQSGILVTFTRRDHEGREIGEEQPILAGPISNFPEEYTDSISFSVSGIREILKYRFILDKDYSTRDGEASEGNMKALKESKVSFTNQSLNYIAEQIVRGALRREAAYVPITFPMPAKANDGTHDRTYYGYNIAENNVDTKLDELSNTYAGPDIMFRPQWRYKSQRTHIVWHMVTGTPGHPEIAQGYLADIDATARESVTSEVSLNARGDLVTRGYATGAGEGKGILLSTWDDDAALQRGIPLLEKVTSSPDTKRFSTVSGHAQALVRTTPIIELICTVDGNDTRSSITDMYVGDAVQVTMNGGFYVRGGTKMWRLVRVVGDFDTTHITLYLQEE